MTPTILSPRPAGRQDFSLLCCGSCVGTERWGVAPAAPGRGAAEVHGAKRAGWSELGGKAERGEQAARDRRRREDGERLRSPGSGAPGGTATFSSVLLKTPQIKHWGHFKNEYHSFVK